MIESSAPALGAPGVLLGARVLGVAGAAAREGALALALANQGAVALGDVATASIATLGCQMSHLLSCLGGGRTKRNRGAGTVVETPEPAPSPSAEAEGEED